MYSVSRLHSYPLSSLDQENDIFMILITSVNSSCHTGIVKSLENIPTSEEDERRVGDYLFELGIKQNLLISC